MSKAIVEHIRVYDNDNGIDPAPYKFDDAAEIKGMSNSDINAHDYRAIETQLFNIGVKVARWRHKGVNRVRKIRLFNY